MPNYNPQHALIGCGCHGMLGVVILQKPESYRMGTIAINIIMSDLIHIPIYEV